MDRLVRLADGSYGRRRTLLGTPWRLRRETDWVIAGACCLVLAGVLPWLLGRAGRRPGA
jgi:hypothetical protein